MLPSRATRLDVKLIMRRILCNAAFCASVLGSVSSYQVRAQTADANGRQATTVQLPTFGVSIDAEGVLRMQVFEDPGGRLRQQRIRAAKGALAADIVALAALRKVSLVKLEQAIRRRLDQGQPVDEAMHYLAGLQRLQYVFFYPETNDIVIAGPAEGWIADPSGRVVGLTTGRPVLELADLLVALRAYPPGESRAMFIGCTIDPTPEGLARLQQFQRQIPRAVPDDQREVVAGQVGQGIRESLGMAKIRVFGVPADTHFAAVLIEADYRMKLIGLGLERPPVKIVSMLELSGSAAMGTLQRWWFTPNYDCLKTTDDRLSLELVGQGVQLLSESKLVGPDGQLAAATAPNKASETFAAGFTRQYPALSAVSPVYAQMRNLIDMVVAAAFMQQQHYADRAGWQMATFGDEVLLPVRTSRTPEQVEAAVNVVWKGSRLLAPAGGGVSIRAEQALATERILGDKDGKLRMAREKVGDGLPLDRWWWD